MLEILSITGPIYIVILIGFIATRTGLFSKSDLAVLGKFVMNFALPALLVSSLSQRRVYEIMNIGYLLAYSAGSLVVLAGGYAWARYLFRQSVTTSAFYAMGMTCSNSAYVGYPVLLLTVKSVAGVSLALNMMVENLIMIPLLLVIAEHGRGGAAGWSRILLKSITRLAKNPLIIGLIAGFCISAFGWRLPEIVVRPVNLFAMASGALSLFVVGGTLVGLSVQGVGRQIAPIAFGKLLLHPLAVLLALLSLHFLGIRIQDPSLRMAAVIMAAVPMLSIYTILALAYDQQNLTAAAMLVTTFCSFFTLSGLLMVLKHMALLG